MARQSIAAAFLSFDEPIGRVVGTDVYPTESFLRLMESLFLRTGGEADQIKAVADTTDVVKEAADDLIEGQAALDEAVTLAQEAAATADAKAAEAKADAALVAADVVTVNAQVVVVDDAVTDLNTVTIPALDARITALE